jgi:hypothetical protein
MRRDLETFGVFVCPIIRRAPETLRSGAWANVLKFFSAKSWSVAQLGAGALNMSNTSVDPMMMLERSMGRGTIAIQQLERSVDSVLQDPVIPLHKN